MTPETIHTYSMESHWKFQGGWGEIMKFYFWRGGVVQPQKKPSVGGGWKFHGTVQ